jgi:propanediol utilization protein
MTVKRVPIEVSARHIHLCKKDLELLFGKGYELKKMKDLTQPCDFAAHETIVVQADHKRLTNVRIVGPVREKTQIELSITDAISLGTMPPVKMSGDLKGTPGVILIGPERRVHVQEGMIIPQRHLHLNEKEARQLKLKNGTSVSIKVEGERAIVFENVEVRVRKDYKLCLHLDTDEGNAAGIARKGEGIIVNGK